MSNEPIDGLVTVHKRERTASNDEDKSPERTASSAKKRKFKIVANDSPTPKELSPNTSIKSDIEPSAPESLKDLMGLVRIVLQFLSCIRSIDRHLISSKLFFFF